MGEKYLALATEEDPHSLTENGTRDSSTLKLLSLLLASIFFSPSQNRPY